MSNLTNNTSELQSILAAVQALPPASGSGGGITPSGTKTITANGEGIDVTNYAAVNVRVPEPNIQPLTVTENGTYTPSGDVDGYGSVTVNVSGGSSDADAALTAVINRTVTSVSSNVDKVGNFAFRDCTKLKTANLPIAKSIGQYAFSYCYALMDVHIPEAITISSNVFKGSSIQTIDLPVATTVGTGSFADSNLTTLIIRTTSQVCTLSNKNAFTGTPIEDGTGYIYVPATLVDSYKAASNWANYSAQIRAIEDYPEITGG